MACNQMFSSSNVEGDGLGSAQPSQLGAQPLARSRAALTAALLRYSDRLKRVPLLVACAGGFALALMGGLSAISLLALVLLTLIAAVKDAGLRVGLFKIVVAAALSPLLWWPAQGWKPEQVELIEPRGPELMLIEVLEGGRSHPEGQQVSVAAYEWRVGLEGGRGSTLSDEPSTKGEVGALIAARLSATLRVDQPLRAGSRWLAYGSMQAPSLPYHAQAFDPQAFAVSRRVQGRFRLEAAEIVLIERASGWRAWLDARRQAVEADLLARFEPKIAGVLAALLTGSKGYLDREVRLQFAAQGVAHVLAVSGLHMALVLLLTWRLLTGLLALLPERFCVAAPRVAAALTLPLVPFYVVLTGGAASARRAGVMVSVVLISWLLARPGSATRALSLAFIGWLLVTPELAADLGFQLSVAASAGLILLSLHLPVEIDSISRRSRLYRLWRWLLGALVVGQVAAAATAPALFSVFGEAPLLSPIANLIVVPPLAAVAMPAALLGAALDLVAPWAAELPWWVAGASVELALWSAGVIDPWLSVPLVWGLPSAAGRWGWSLLAAVTVLLGRWCLLLGARGHGPRAHARSCLRASLALLAPAAALIACDLPPAYHPPQGVRIHAIPVGHGDASLVELPCGLRVLIDAGGSGFDGGGVGRAAVLSYLRARGIWRVDVFVSSHGHADHAGGLLELLPVLRPAELWVGRIRPEHNRLEAALVESAARGGVRLIELDERGSQLRRGDVTIDVFGRSAEHMGINNDSLVMRVCYAGSCALFTGDAEREREFDLLSSRLNRWRLRAQVLKVGHHGSRTSTTPRFLRAVDPTLAVVHVGDRFGLPSPLVIDRIADTGTQIIRTDTRRAYQVELLPRRIALSY